MKTENKRKKMIVTDLDGTLYQTGNRISNNDYLTLIKLSEMNIIRVIATGRNLYSANKVLPDDFPIDYLIFSSGAGIMDWLSKKLLLSYYMKPEEVKSAVSELVKHQIDFMIHNPVPDNHHFFYFHTGKNNPDFIRRIDRYKQFAMPIKSINDFSYKEASQLVGVEKCENCHTKYDTIKFNLDSSLKIIKTTSPLDGKSIWIEIFPLSVSKSLAGQYIANIEAVHSNNIATVGNDYNDIDLLNWTKKSFVVNNAPDELKNKYKCVSSNNENGFTEAVSLWLGLEPEYLLKNN